MDAKQQNILYTLINLAIRREKKSLSLAMADTQMGQDYPMVVEELKRYIVKTYSRSQVYEEVASSMINMETGEFIPVKGFSFVCPKNDAELARLVDKFKLTWRAYTLIKLDNLNYAIATFRTADAMRTSFRNSFPNEEIAKKLDIFISYKPYVEKLFESNHIDTKFYDIMRSFRAIVKLAIPALYKICLAKGESRLFFDIFDSAYLDATNSGIKSNNIEKILNDNYEFYGFPVRKHKYAHYIVPKIQETSTPIPPKPTTVKKVSSTKTKTSSVTKPSTTKVASATTKVVEKPIVETIKKVEPVILDGPVNILDISTKTKIGKFYKIEKVENKAKKIIIDDSVSEIVSNAFQNCKLLEEITLGKNLKVLEFGLFNYLLKLEKVNFVEGLVEIKNNVFDNSGLTGYHKLPQSLERIGKLAFNVKLPSYLQLSLSKETKLEEKSIHRLVKLDLYEPTKPKTNTNKTKSTSTAKASSVTTVDKPTSTTETISKVVVSSEIEENYKKGEQIYYKYSGKKKMLEAAKLMEAKANAGDLDACELVLKAYTYAEKIANADKYIELFIKHKKVDIVYWVAEKLKFVKGYASRSKDLYLFAAENGIIDSYKEVASFYIGYGNVPEDHNKVMEYYLKGANLGCAECLRHLADIYRNGLGEVIKPNKTKYLEYVQKAAEANNYVAQYWLGNDYYEGKNGLKKDKAKAKYWFDKAVNNPNHTEISKKVYLDDIQKRNIKL